jgi:hypothetical protein
MRQLTLAANGVKLSHEMRYWHFENCAAIREGAK